MNYQAHNTYTPSTDDQQNTARPVQVRETGGTNTITLRKGSPVVDTRGLSSVSTSGIDGSTDWRGTARAESGMPVTRITPSTIVSIGEYGESSVKTFLTMGVLRETAPGFYEMVEASHQAQDLTSSRPGEDLDHPDSASMPEDMAQAVDQALEPFNQAVVDSALASGMAVAIGDMDEAALIQRVAKQSGMEPSEAAERIQFTMNAYQAQTDHYLSKNGIGPEDLEGFYDFVTTAQKGELRAALESQFYAQDMSPWKGLVSRYMQEVPPTVEALQAAGFQVQGDKVKIQGDWMPIAGAARAGLI